MIIVLLGENKNNIKKGRRMIEDKVIKALRSKNRKVVEDAFEEVYYQYYKLLYYIAIKILNDSEKASDIVNDVFLAFFNNIKKIDLYKNIKYYLVTATKNSCLNELKKQKLKVEYDDEIINQVIDHKESKVWEEYIEEFKKFLSIEEVEIIVDHLVFEYTFKEIAAIRGVSLFAISSKYKRAIDKLKKYYERGELDV